MTTWERDYGSVPTPWAKYYRTNRWAKISKFCLKRDKLCAQCLRDGKVEPAVLTHHTIPYRENSTPLDFWRGPFEVLCFSCHEVIHGRAKSREYISDIGADGWPLDPTHPANQNLSYQEREQRKCKTKR